MNIQNNKYIIYIAIFVFIYVIYICISCVYGLNKLYNTQLKSKLKLSYVNTSIEPYIVNNNYIYYFKESDTITFTKPTLISSILISGGISYLPPDPNNNNIYNSSLFLYCIIPSINISAFYTINALTYNIVVGTSGKASSFNNEIVFPPIRSEVGIPSNLLVNQSIYNYSLMPINDIISNNYKLKQPINNNITDNGGVIIKKNLNIHERDFTYDNSSSLITCNKLFINYTFSPIIIDKTLINLINGYDGSEFNSGCVIIIIDPSIN
jgi:hypothetical protein